MKEVKEGDILNNFYFWKTCVIISSITKKVTLNDISKETGISKSSPYFYSIIKFLEANDFLNIDKSRTPHIYSINNARLSWFLREGKIFDYFICLLNTNFTFKLIGLTLTKPYYIG